MGVLEVKQAQKSFGAIRALDGVSMEIQPGEMVALLGPNGAGKTTLVRAIAGRVRLDSGSIELFGRPADNGDVRARRQLGVVPQEVALYPLLTARENLTAWGRLHGVAGAELTPRVERALEWTALADRAEEPIGGFSGGMKRRLNIACGVLHEPRVVLLDEPTASVDPQSRQRIYDMLGELRDSGVSLLLTTHQLEEAEDRCGRIVIIDHGRVIAAGTLGELVERTIGAQRRVTLTVDRPPACPLRGFENGARGVELHAQVDDVAGELPALLAAVRSAGCTVLDLDVHSPRLNAVFLHLTGRELRD